MEFSSKPKTDEMKNAPSELLAHTAVQILIEKKALDVRLYHPGERSSVTDYYLNVTGRSVTQVSALVDSLVEELGRRGRDPLRIEGKRGTTWFLVDFGDLIVNVFDRPSREFYNFDRLMPEECAVSIEEDILAVDAKMSAAASSDEN